MNPYRHDREPCVECARREAGAGELRLHEERGGMAATVKTLRIVATYVRKLAEEVQS